MQKVHKAPLVIIGGGPAGYTAALYAARAALNPILVQGPEPGGQLMLTTDVENYPGFSLPIQGPWLMQEMAQQARNCGATLMEDTITRVDFQKSPFLCYGEKASYESDAVIICTGAKAKWLGLPQEEFFRGHGVSSCAVCDGFFFRQKKVLVVGGGNTAVEEALFLARQSDVTLLHRRGELRAEKILQKKLLENPRITVVWHHVLEDIVGTEDPKKVTGALVRHVVTGATQMLPVDGIFIAIGHSPNTDIFRHVLLLDEEGYIVDKGMTQTEIPGIFSAGDVRDKIYRQAVTAAAQGCEAALDVERYLTKICK